MRLHNEFLIRAVIKVVLIGVHSTVVGPSTRPAFLISGQSLKIQTFMVLKQALGYK